MAEILDATLRETGYLEALEAERTIEAEGRVENLQELIGVAGEFDANRAMEGDSDTSPLEEFLAQISLLSDQDSMREGESLITLMTLHNAKGLEYEAVFLIGCEEGVFPHSRSIEEGNLEEERRLCYVGLTRARQRLYLSCARRRSLFGGSGYNLPSRFLGELPDKLVERQVSAPRTGWQSGGGGSGGRAAVLGGSFGSRGGGLPTTDDLRKPPNPEHGLVPHRRRRRPRLVRRGGRDLGRARLGRGRPLRLRRQRAQADGRLRADPQGGLMAATVIDGKAVAAAVRAEVARGAVEFEAAAGRRAGLATVLVGDDPASHVYVGSKRKQTEEAGMRSIHHGLHADASPGELLNLVAELAVDDDVDGILVQLPLPDGHDQDQVIERIPAAKDVDGLTVASAGLLAQGRPGLVPCTPQGVVELLRAGGTQIEGAEVAIVGRSILVGRPLASLLVNANATVTMCHSRTRDLAAVCSPGGRDRRCRRSAGPRHRRDGPAGRHRDRRGHKPHRRRPGGRRGLRRRQRGRGSDNAGSRRGRPDDDRDAPAQHARCSARPSGGRIAVRPSLEPGRSDHRRL